MEKAWWKEAVVYQIYPRSFCDSNGDGTLNVHIRRIREAIEREPGNPEYIITMWGDGYKFAPGGKG